MIDGKVLFTDNVDYEVSKIISLSDAYAQKIYVYGRNTSLVGIQGRLPGFVFVRLEEILKPDNVNIFINYENIFFVIKCIRFSDIMDRNVDWLQMAKGYKLVVDTHPFLGKGDVAWCYFLWSFFDRSLLGYPHCYAFQTDLKRNAPDYAALAMKVLPKTETTIEKIFYDDIIVQQYSLAQEIHEEYQIMKKQIFEESNTEREIIKRLKRFVNDKCPDLKKGFDLITFSRIFEQYQKGLRLLTVSDLKVDAFLEMEFWSYVKNVNTFMGTLWNNQK